MILYSCLEEIMSAIYVRQYLTGRESLWYVWKDNGKNTDKAETIGGEYLHADGTWHEGTRSDSKITKFPGLFRDQAAARVALALTGETAVN